MGNSNWTFRCAFSDGRSTTEADSVSVTCKLLTAGVVSGSDLLSSGAMTQYHPGLYTLTTSDTPLTRGLSYRATYSIYWQGDVGTAYETQTQDFTVYTTATAAAVSNTQLTLADARRIVRKALGLKSDGATEADNQEPASATADEIANDTMERLWRDAKWTFQSGDPLYVDLLQNQYRYRLPADYLELKKVFYPSSQTYTYVRKPVEWIREQRENNVTVPPFVTYYAVSWDPGSSVAAQGYHYLDIWPTPTAYAQDAMVIDYTREAPKLSAATDIIPVPAGMMSLVKQALRAEATLQDNRPNAPLEEQRYQQLLAMAKEHDGRHRTPFIGRMSPDCDMTETMDPDNYINPDLNVTRS